MPSSAATPAPLSIFGAFEGPDRTGSHAQIFSAPGDFRCEPTANQRDKTAVFRGFLGVPAPLISVRPASDLLRSAKVGAIHPMNAFWREKDEAPPSLDDVAAALEDLATRTGEIAFERAARALYQSSPGRKAVDDRAALAEVRWLLETGEARSLNDALRMVAKSLRGSGNIRSVAERLRRKWLQTQISSTQ